MNRLALLLVLTALVSVATVAALGNSENVNAASKKHQNLCEKHPTKKQCGGGGPPPPSCDDPIPPPECCFPDCPASFNDGQAHVIFVAKKTPDQKADQQSEKGHVRQADRACEKGGFDGYLGENGNGDCGFLG